MEKGLELEVCYAGDGTESKHTAIYAVECISAVNAIPIDHPDVPAHTRRHTDHPVIAVVLIKFMEAFTQAFVLQSFEEVKAKLISLGIEIH